MQTGLTLRDIVDETSDFYPTPGTLISKMLAGLKPKDVGDYARGAILEPSAGKGDIIKAIQEHHEYDSWGHHEFSGTIDAIEIDENLRNMLKGQDIRVIYDDFLRFHTFKHYDLIIMNPPFSEGDKHLLKAIDMQKNGGRIVCVLNAETLNNPYTNTRRDLARKLEDLGANIEFITQAFRTADAERKTDVEIALIKIDIPKPEPFSNIMDDLKKDTTDYTFGDERSKALVHSDLITGMVEQFNFEVRAGLNLIAEYNAMVPHIMDSVKKEYSNPILKLEIDDRESAYKDVANEYVRKVRYKYWEALLDKKEFTGSLTSNLQNEFHGRIKELQHYDFSLYNIEAIKRELILNTVKGIERTILALFEKFSNTHHYTDETSKNIHYYNGWKTNKAWIVNKKVILPMYGAFDSYDGKFKMRYGDNCRDLSDAEKVLNYLDQGRTSSWRDMGNNLCLAENTQQTRNVDSKYFRLTFYKKGTCHIEFKDLDLLKKFNIFGSQRKKWLPPSYGKATYAEMNEEEKAVINEFEGEESYRETMAKKDFYLVEASNLLMLAAGNNNTDEEDNE